MYSILRMRGNPVIALPEGTRRLRLGSVSRIQGFTPKRALFRFALRCAVLSGVDQLPWFRAADPLSGTGFDLGRWSDETFSDARDTALAVIWPWPPGSYRGRVYVHAMDRRSGEPLAFSKISLREDQDERLRTEAATLGSLQGSVGSAAKVPELITVGTSQGRVFLTVTQVPETARPARLDMAFPHAIAASIAGASRTMPAEEALRSHWWSRFLRHGGGVYADFLAEATAHLRVHGLTVCRAHGDFSVKNLLVDGDTLWIVDWEDSDAAAPHLTDWVAFHVESGRAEGLRNPAGALQKLIATAAGGRRVDVGLALAYLQQAGSGDAARLLAQWPGAGPA